MCNFQNIYYMFELYVYRTISVLQISIYRQYLPILNVSQKYSLQVIWFCIHDIYDAQIVTIQITRQCILYGYTAIDSNHSIYNPKRFSQRQLNNNII